MSVSDARSTGQPNLKRQKQEKKKLKSANQILTHSQFHIKKKKMLSFILSFISFIPFFITYKFIQSYSFSEIKRERES